MPAAEEQEPSVTSSPPNGAEAIAAPLAPINPHLQRVVWGALVLIIAGLLALFVRQQWLGAERRGFTTLDRFRTIPDFTLTERSGQPLDSAQALRGKVWVANFFFTACPGPCLAMNARMSDLQEAIRRKNDEVRLVSFTVNPAQDTPETLRRYAERFHANPERWFFLTGDRNAIYKLAHESFMLGVTDASTGEEKLQEGEFIHSTKLALVDRQGVVRGYYDSGNREVIPQLLTDIGNVLREQPRP